MTLNSFIDSIYCGAGVSARQARLEIRCDADGEFYSGSLYDFKFPDNEHLEYILNHRKHYVVMFQAVKKNSFIVWINKQ